ncbi:MAG: DUF3341 domain-containing protein [bacterium]|jgi:hypothetical protein
MTDRRELLQVAPVPGEKKLLGLLAEFKTPQELLEGAEKVRDAGYKHWDAHTPFPVHGLNDAMGLRGTPLPYFVFMIGLSGCIIGLLLQWWTNAFDYPFVISGKPLWSIPANIPVVFELTVLFSAIGAFFGMLAFNGLPKYYHSIFNSKVAKRATTDRFYIAIDARDPKFDAEETRKLLESLQTSWIEELYEVEGDAS